MALAGGDNLKHYAMGAIRNAQLMVLTFPNWILRIFISSDTADIITEKYLATLQLLGAQIVIVENSRTIPPAMLHLLAADDTSAEVVLFRNADERLSARDSALVADWLRADSVAAVHRILIRKHFLQNKNEKFVEKTMFGVFPGKLKSLLRHSVAESLLLDTLQVKSWSTVDDNNVGKPFQTILDLADIPAEQFHSVSIFRNSTHDVIESDGFRLSTANVNPHYSPGARFNMHNMPVMVGDSDFTLAAITCKTVELKPKVKSQSRSKVLKHCPHCSRH